MNDIRELQSEKGKTMCPNIGLVAGNKMPLVQKNIIKSVKTVSILIKNYKIINSRSITLYIIAGMTFIILHSYHTAFNNPD